MARRRDFPTDLCPAGRFTAMRFVRLCPSRLSDPVVYPWQRPDSEGKVVIEITIDERGEIVRKTVLQSLGPKIDEQMSGRAGELAFSAGHSQRSADCLRSRMPFSPSRRAVRQTSDRASSRLHPHPAAIIKV